MEKIHLYLLLESGLRAFGQMSQKLLIKFCKESLAGISVLIVGPMCKGMACVNVLA